MKQKLLLWIGITAFILGTVACGTATGTPSTQTPAPEATGAPVVEADVVEVHKTELVVESEKEIADLDALAAMGLKMLDLTRLPETPFETITELKLRLPDCEILWNQRLNDGVFRSDSTALKLPNATEEDLRALDLFEQLTLVDCTGSTAYEALFAFAAAHPGTEVRYAYTDGAFTVLSSDESAFVPEGVDAGAFTSAAPYFPNLQSVDLRGSDWTDEQLDAFCAQNRTLCVQRTVQIGGLRFDSGATALNLREVTGFSADALIAMLRAFESLDLVALPSDFTQQDVDAFSAAYPNVSLPGTAEAFGRSFDQGAEEIDLSGISMESDEPVRALIGDLPFVRTVVMCDCGLSDEQMDALRSEYPGVKFVWVVKIGSRKLRTDAIGFSTKNPSKYTNPNSSDAYNQSVKTAERLKEGDIEALRYCTDLEALDLGHNYLTDRDLAVISGLTKLKILILADNKITDISALTTLKDLEYIELFMNEIPDLSPLTELKNLVDVNVCKVGVTDLSPLYELTSVRRLWYALNPVSREEAKRLADALPDCLCNYTVKSSTDGGWREDPRYQWMRAYFN